MMRAGEHHQDAVGKRHQLVELDGDQEDRRPSARWRMISPWIASVRADVDAAGRLIDEQEACIAGELARQHHLLDVAAGEPLHRRFRAPRADIEALDQRLRLHPAR